MFDPAERSLGHSCRSLDLTAAPSAGCFRLSSTRTRIVHSQIRTKVAQSWPTPWPMPAAN